MTTMPSDCLSFRDTNYFSSLICDYLDQKDDLKPFYNRFPTLENFKPQIEEKELSIRAESRTILVSSLKQQYKSTNASDPTLNNIASLSNSKTFTVTTGHQLNLFTGPLYFLYKIVSAINLSKELKTTYPEYNFVPVYWMATEDHDFDEINHFNFKGKKVEWSRDASGAVGHLNTDGLDKVFKAFTSELNTSNHAQSIQDLFKNAYLKNKTLTEATRYLANELFKDYGLVIVDGDDSNLKRLFIPYVEEELLKQTSHETVKKTSNSLSKISDSYRIQVNPRAINLFYLNDGLRERIVEVEGMYSVFRTDITWSKDALLKEVNDFPERFSPNVIMRPLYQEVILPNLCYIGGGGELAYWFQLKNYFRSQGVTFPILLLRNSVLIQTEKQLEKLEKLNVSTNELFLGQQELITKKVKELSKVDVDFTPQKKHLEEQFVDLYNLAKKTDASFLGAVEAQERKQIKGLENLEKRLIKAQKRKLKDHTDRIIELQDQLFPRQSLQERNTNFSEFYLEYGDTLILNLIDALKPLEGEFSILTF